MWTYGATSVHLRDIAAAVCHRLCNAIIPWEDVFALVTSRLIALDKCLGVRPIGIGETLHRVVGKTICLATRIDVTMACGSDQLCGGLSSGIEGDIHSMSSLFVDHPLFLWIIKILILVRGYLWWMWLMLSTNRIVLQCCYMPMCFGPDVLNFFLILIVAGLC